MKNKTQHINHHFKNRTGTKEEPPHHPHRYSPQLWVDSSTAPCVSSGVPRNCCSPSSPATSLTDGGARAATQSPQQQRQRRDSSERERERRRARVGEMSKPCTVAACFAGLCACHRCMAPRPDERTGNGRMDGGWMMMESLSLSLSFIGEGKF